MAHIKMTNRSSHQNWNDFVKKSLKEKFYEMTDSILTSHESNSLILNTFVFSFIASLSRKI